MSDYTQRYHDYWDSPQWSQVRKAVWKRSGGNCERCGLMCAFAVHHKKYKGVIYNELEHLDQLIHVCGCCHDWIHRDKTGSTYDPIAYQDPIARLEAMIRDFQRRF